METMSEALTSALTHRREGRLRDAIASYRRALEIDPDSSEALNELGTLLQDQGNLDEAEECFRRALSVNENLAQAHSNLGRVLKVRGRLDEAIACYQRALVLNPQLAEAFNNLGNALWQQRNPEQAIECYRRAIERKPAFAQAHYNLGVVLGEQGKLDDAIACYRRAIEFRSDYSDALNNLGSTFRKVGRLEEAVTCLRRALEVKPDCAQANYNLAIALHQQEKLDEAVAYFQRTTRLQPNHFEAYNNLGFTFHEQLILGQAVNCYRRAIELKPDYAAAHVNLARLMLLCGDFDQGCAEYEWRWQTGQLPARNFRQPRWDGEPLNGRTILLYAEQGLGDTVQFVRYAPLLKALGGRVVVECQPGLLKLLGQCPGIDHLVGEGDELPTFDVQSPLMSLPRVFKTAIETIPANGPYLFADPALINHWRERVAEFRGFRIGINWRGRSGQGRFRHRDIPLEYFARLAQVPGVQLFSLQKGAEREELVGAGGGPPIIDLAGDADEAHGQFMDTAAIMMNLDLVITSDTSIPHLAGALGVPVWLALPHVPDWRWLLNRNDSPWYPTMRLFRQNRAGDWAGVFEEIEAALQRMAGT